MRGCVTAALLSFLLLLSSSAFGQCTYTAAYSGAFRTTYYDVSADPYEVWAATGYGVQLFARVDAPKTVDASIALPGVTRVIRSGNHTAYVGSGTMVYILANPQPVCPITCPTFPAKITTLGSFDTGATVNDILVTTTYLYVATSNGLRQYDLLVPANPSLTSAVFPTSGANVSSLSMAGDLLYAADGDSSVEVFDLTIPSIPQKAGSLQSLPRSTAVHATATRVYVSDGQNTDVFVGSGAAAAKAATVPFGSTAFAASSGDTVFAAGTDRRVRALDWSNTGTPVEVYSADILPTGGSVNRAAAMTIQGGALYIAAGDAGLQAYDINGFHAPFPVRSYATGSSSSVLWAGGKLYAARDSGGITEFIKSSSGTLTPGRQWDARIHTLQDTRDTFLLTSTGPSLIEWFLSATIPTVQSSASFKTSVTQAVVVGSTAYAVLGDRTLWSADLTQSPAQLQQIQIGSINPSAIARSGSAVAIADIRDDATTVVSYFSTPDFTKAPDSVSVPGITTTGVALTGSTAALFTFRGISVIDFSTGKTTVLPQSNAELARAISINGSKLYELTDTALKLWDLGTFTFVRDFPLPAGGTALSVDQMAAIATSSGVTGVIYDSTTPTPRLVANRGSNTYYKKVAGIGDRLYLFDGRTVDIFSTTFGAAPHYLAAVGPVIDFAVSPAAMFTVSGSGIVTSYTLDGVATAQAALNEGTDVQPLSIATAGGAPWVALAKGCFVGACQKQTAVLDPRTLVRTMLLDGAVVDVTTAGTRAYSIFDLPAEIRVYDVSNALQPAPLATRPAEGTSTPVSIAQASGTIYVLGEKLYSYSEAALTNIGTQFPSFVADPAGAFRYVDQRVRLDGTCGFVSGRSSSPQLFSVPGWSPAAAPPTPASVRSVAAVAGRLYLLTDDSLEVWTTQAVPAAPRRRAK